MNKSEMHEILTYLFSVYDTPVTDDKLAVWADQFEAVSPEDGKAAARLLVKRGSFGVPKPSDLHSALGELAEKAITPADAWDLLVEAASRIGFREKGRAMEFLAAKDPAIAEVAKTIFEEVCMSDVSDHPTLRAQFWKMLSQTRNKKQNQQLGLIAANGAKEITHER